MQSTSPSIHPGGQRLAGLICLVLVLVTIVLYWPARNFQFNNFDDAQYLTQNPHVQNGLTSEAVGWAFTSGYASNWHPVTWLSHMLDVQLYGFRAGGHHLTNLFFHVANTLLLFLILRRWTGAIWRSAFVAALFAWHPMHVESVAWVAERKDVLSTLFWLLTTGAYLRYVEEFKVQSSRRKVFYRLSLYCFALGLMSKPMLVSLPLILLLLDYWPLQRIQIPFSFKEAVPLLLEKIPFFVLSVVSCLITFVVQKRGGAVQPLENLALPDRLGNAVVSYVSYLGKLFWPTNLAILYPYSRHLPWIEILSAAVVLLVLCGVAARLAKTHPPLIVGWLWFVITLGPVIGVVQVGDLAMADRYTYIPSIGLFVLLAWEVPRLCPRFVWPLALATVIILSACLVATRYQLRFWQDSITLFTHATEVTKNNCVAECNLGLAYANQGLTNEAIQHERKAVEINPNYPEGQDNLGVLLEGQGKWDEATEHLEAALKANPRFESAYYNLGMIDFQQNRLDEAIARFRSALSIDPAFDKPLVNLGIALARQGHMKEAEAQYRKALAVAPNNPYAHNALARALQARQQWNEAAIHYRAVIAAQPDFAAAHENLGVVLMMTWQFIESADQLKEALRLQPDDLEAHFNLALVLWQLEQPNEAIDQYRAVLHLDPQNTQALQKLAWLLATAPIPRLRNAAEALRLATLSTQLAPSDPVSWDVQAAALGESGRYAEAVAAATKALDLATSAHAQDKKWLALPIQSRLELYQSGTPYHQSLDRR